MKKLKDGITLIQNEDLAKQIEAEISQLKSKDYLLFKISNFKKLQSYENQADYNYVVVDYDPRNKPEYTIYDNVDIHEKHNFVAYNISDLSEYVAQLLSCKTVLEFAQLKSLKNHHPNLEFGDVVYLNRPNKTSVLGVVIPYSEAYPDDSINSHDNFLKTIYVVPLKNDLSISKRKPLIVYANYTLTPH